MEWNSDSNIGPSIKVYEREHCQEYFPGMILGEKTPPTLPLFDLHELALPPPPLWLVRSAELEEAALLRFL